VYLFEPTYVEWLINNIDYVFLTDIEELQQLKVIKKPSIDDSITVSLIGDRSLIFPEVIKEFAFIDLKYSGIYDFKFSSRTLEINKKKANSYRSVVEPKVSIDLNNKPIFLNLYSGLAIEICKCKYRGTGYTSKRFKFHMFEFSNLDLRVPILPKVKECIIGLVYIDLTIPLNKICYLVLNYNGSIEIRY
jgi:hypothetical protein